MESYRGRLADLPVAGRTYRGPDDAAGALTRAPTIRTVEVRRASPDAGEEVFDRVAAVVRKPEQVDPDGVAIKGGTQPEVAARRRVHLAADAASTPEAALGIIRGELRHYLAGPLEWQDLHEKVVLVTGGTRGVGLATGLAFGRMAVALALNNGLVCA